MPPAPSEGVGVQDSTPDRPALWGAGAGGPGKGAGAADADHGHYGQEKAAQLSNAFQKQSGIRRLVEYLCVNGLPAELAVRTYRLFGPESLEVLQEDPYVLTQPEIGAGFAAVDAFALRCGVAPDDTRRIRKRGTMSELTYNLRGGHVLYRWTSSARPRRRCSSSPRNRSRRQWPACW